METIAQLSEPSKSLCFRCRYWDWGIDRTIEEKDGATEFLIICNAPNECTPGDRVVECAGFMKMEGK